MIRQEMSVPCAVTVPALPLHDGAGFAAWLKMTSRLWRCEDPRVHDHLLLSGPTLGG